MKTKIRNKLFFLAAILLTMPMHLANAQWTTGKEKISNLGLPKGQVGNILTTILNWLLSIVGVLGVMGFVVAGIMYLTAYGDSDRMKTAKQTMVWSATGVAVALLGVVAVSTIDSLLNR